LAGQGLGCLYEDQIADHVAAGRLIQVLAQWCLSFLGCYLYHLNCRQISPALTGLINVLRFKPTRKQTVRRGGLLNYGRQGELQKGEILSKFNNTLKRNVESCDRTLSEAFSSFRDRHNRINATQNVEINPQKL
jgi:hypothetical protein